MLTDRPLAYTTSGQNVPNDIEVINEQWIAKQLLGVNHDGSGQKIFRNIIKKTKFKKALPMPELSL